jgi:hypothetical protein
VHETEVALQHLERIADVATIYTYETATSDNPATVRRVVAAAGMDIGLVEAAGLARRWRRAKAERISSHLVKTNAGTYDPTTLLHPGHVAGERAVDESTLHELRQSIAAGRFADRVEAIASRAT